MFLSFDMLCLKHKIPDRLGKRSDPGRTAGNNRLFVEAVLWVARTGSP
jgi:hypothetical protein